MDAGDAAPLDAALALSCVGGGGLEPGAPWPMFRRCPGRTASSPFPGPDLANANMKWSTSAALTSVVIAADGSIYGWRVDGVYAVSAADGSTQRILSVPPSLVGPHARSLALAADGTIVVRTPEALLSIRRDGTVLWTLDARPAGNDEQIAIGNDGTIYYTGYDVRGASLRAATPSGHVKWSAEPPDSGAGSAGILSPAVGPDGTTYVVSGEGLLSAISSDGVLVWSRPAPVAGGQCGGQRGHRAAAPVVSDDGVIYLSGASLDAIRRDGSVLWTATLPGELCLGAPVVGTDGTIYVPGSRALVYAIRPDGSTKWVSREAPGDSAILSGNGNLYATDASNASLYQIDPAGSTVARWNSSAGAYGECALGAAGNLYVQGVHVTAIAAGAYGDP